MSCRDKAVLEAITMLLAALDVDPFDVYDGEYLIERVKEVTQ